MTKPQQFESMGALLGVLRGQGIKTVQQLNEAINHEAPTIAKAHGLDLETFGRFIRRNYAVIIDTVTNQTGGNKA
jgi:hypothetical protein